MDNIDLDVPKYLKKKGSSVSKSKVKANNKHEYIDCLFREETYNRIVKGSYCKICGKIGDIKFFDLKNSHLKTDDEILAEGTNLPIIHIHSSFDKYINT
jgi:hypothetical protein